MHCKHSAGLGFWGGLSCVLRSHQPQWSLPIEQTGLPPNPVLGLSGNPAAPSRCVMMKLPGKTLLHLRLLFQLPGTGAVVPALGWSAQGQGGSAAQELRGGQDGVYLAEWAITGPRSLRGHSSLPVSHSHVSEMCQECFSHVPSGRSEAQATCINLLNLLHLLSFI